MAANRLGSKGNTVAGLDASKIVRLACFAAVATSRGHALVDRELYLPKSGEMVEADCARAGRWNSVLKKPKEKWAWMSMKSVPGTAGIVTLRFQC